MNWFVSFVSFNSFCCYIKLRRKSIFFFERSIQFVIVLLALSSLLFSWHHLCWKPSGLPPALQQASPSQSFCKWLLLHEFSSWMKPDFLYYSAPLSLGVFSWKSSLSVYLKLHMMLFLLSYSSQFIITSLLFSFFLFVVVARATTISGMLKISP